MSGGRFWPQALSPVEPRAAGRVCNQSERTGNIARTVGRRIMGNVLATGGGRSERSHPRCVENHAPGHGHRSGSRPSARATNSLPTWSARPIPRSASSPWTTIPKRPCTWSPAARNRPRLQHPGDQLVDRRQADPAGDAGRRERIPHPAAADRGPGRCVGADRRASVSVAAKRGSAAARSSRWPAPPAAWARRAWR